jgi:hypothetical protein
MRWTERVIAAHKDHLSERPPDRRGELIARWERSRSDNGSEPAVEMALQLVADGNANERELAFYVLMDLALTEPVLRGHINQLTNHRSASARRELAFHLSRQFLPELRAMRTSERNSKVIRELDYWIPLLEVGYVPSRRRLLACLTSLP